MARNQKQQEQQGKTGKKAFRLAIGTEIEVLSTEEGFNGVWYRAQFIDDFDSHYLVQYLDLHPDEDVKKKLQEMVEVKRVRPRPPPIELKRRFVAGECVEAWDKDGWWMGKVLSHFHSHDEYLVHFELLGTTERHFACNLRPLQEFRNGIWGHRTNTSATIQELVDAFLNDSNGSEGSHNEEHDTFRQAAKYQPCITDRGQKNSSLTFSSELCKTTVSQEENVRLVSCGRPKKHRRCLGVTSSAMCSSEVVAGSENNELVSSKANGDLTPIKENKFRKVAEPGGKLKRMKSRVNGNIVAADSLGEYLDTIIATIARVTNSDGSCGLLDEAAVMKRLQIFSYQAVVLAFHQQGVLDWERVELLERLRQHLDVSNNTHSLILKHLRKK